MTTPGDYIGRREKQGMVFYMPHPKAKKCRGCGQPADPGDIAWVHKQYGENVGAWCIGCVRAKQAMLLREMQADESHLGKVQRIVDSTPELIPAPRTHLTEQQREANIINRLILENAGR